jgi:hypothetical protein
MSADWQTQDRDSHHEQQQKVVLNGLARQSRSSLWNPSDPADHGFGGHMMMAIQHGCQ